MAKKTKNTEWWFAVLDTETYWKRTHLDPGYCWQRNKVEHNGELKIGSTFSQHHLVNKVSLLYDLNTTVTSDLENLGTLSRNLLVLYF